MLNAIADSGKLQGMRRFVDGAAAFSCRLSVDLAVLERAHVHIFFKDCVFFFLVFFLHKI